MSSYLPSIIVREQPSMIMNIFVPIIAVFLTLLTGSIIFSLMGFNPLFALYTEKNLVCSVHG